MAFKKNNEGRVYFQGSNGQGTSPRDSRATEARSDLRKSAPQQPSPQGQPTQVQILSLLRSLNEKLKSTQLERNVMRGEMEEYRRSMEGLQQKAQRGERAEKLAQETMKELEETRKLLLDLEERQSGIEKEHQTNSEKIRVGVGSYRDLVKRVETTEKKQEDIDRKVEEATSQQARIMRQVEKAIEDRTRFMRKIERIEETVIQTRDALNAKAMVLLTDQKISGGIPTDIEAAMREVAEQIEPGMPMQVEEHAPVRETGRSAALQAAAILLLVVGGILAGWAVSEMQRPQTIDSGEFSINQDSAPIEKTEAPVSQENTEGVETIVDKWNVNQDTSAFNDTSSDAAVTAAGIATENTPAQTTPAKTDPADDIGTLDVNDQEKIQKMLEEDPDALAAELNKIEPSSAQAAPQVPSPSSSIEMASLPVQETTSIEHDEPVATETPPVLQKSNADLRKLIRPDSNLPEIVQKIEAQAFDGVPEAQHDLAAIYTAGHAGVKQDYKRAFFWFEQAANAGIANAAYNLGVLYHQGLGTKANLKKAITWYERAASLGHPEAQYNLGIAYIEGVGVSYNATKAKAYFEKAAAHGIMEAAYNLGLIYENGLLGKPEPDQALVWYKEAADKGSPEAKAALEQLAKTLNIRGEDVDRVVDSARKGKTGDASAPAVQIRGDALRDKNEALRAQIQEHLMSLGLYPGPADGADSPLSQDAIRAYQSLNKMETTGLASNDLLQHMLSE